MYNNYKRSRPDAIDLTSDGDTTDSDEFFEREKKFKPEGRTLFNKNMMSDEIINIMWSLEPNEHSPEYEMRQRLTKLDPRFQSMIFKAIFGTFVPIDTEYDMFQALQQQNKLIRGLEIKSGIIMAKLPYNLETVPNTGGGDCMFSALGQIFGYTSNQIRKFTADGLLPFIKNFQNTKAVLFGIETDSVWDYIKDNMLTNSTREHDRIQLIKRDCNMDSKCEQKAFQTALMEPGCIWGSSVYLEMLLSNSDFPPSNMNIRVLMLDLTLPIGEQLLPGLHCFPDQSDHIDSECSWVMLLRTTTDGTSSGGKHYEMLRVSGTNNGIYRTNEVNQILTNLGYRNIDNNDDKTDIRGCLDKIAMCSSN